MQRTPSSAVGNANCVIAVPARTPGWIRGAAITTGRLRSPGQRTRRTRTPVQVLSHSYRIFAAATLNTTLDKRRVDGVIMWAYCAGR